MNIQKMIESGSNALFVVSADDLKEFALALIAEAAAVKDQGESEDVMSADEVCEVLGISQNSLWRWGKSGYLRGSKVGRKTFYRKSDVDSLLKGKGA